MKWGLYIHIPFCARICHYCDFAKTAIYDGEHVTRYLDAVKSQLSTACAQLPMEQLHSVYFGGGTPGLFDDQYASLMEIVKARVSPDAEITIEANPEDVSPGKLKTWRALGFNRLSFGLQSFDKAGRDFLTRELLMPIEALSQAVEYFDNVNLDLIYGWPGQTMSAWQTDLAKAIEVGVQHLSLYELTYEPATVIGRRKQRGKIRGTNDETLAAMYEMACETLREGWVHEEVSNWAKNERRGAQHNALYWQDQPYLGIGCGAHGYLRGDAFGPWGVRYAAPRHDRTYMKTLSGMKATFYDPHWVDETRQSEDWLIEFIGASLRTVRGTPISSASAKTGKMFKPTPTVAHGLDTGALDFRNEILCLDPKEWFREQSWAVHVLESFVSA